MDFQLQTYPPLSQVTVLTTKTVTLTAVLQLPSIDTLANRWELAVWRRVDNGDWTTSAMEQVTCPMALPLLDKNKCTIAFQAPLSFDREVRFTLKFRSSKDQEWSWIKDEKGFHDGHILAQSTAPASQYLSDLIPDLDKAWAVSSVLSQSPRTQLWSLEATIPGANGDESAHRDFCVGTPWSSFIRWFALVQHSPAWLGPRQGGSCLELDQGGVLCAFLGASGRHLVFLALSDIHNVVVLFCHTRDGSLGVKAQNDGQQEERVTLLVAEGSDFDNAVAAVMYHARSLAVQRKTGDPLPQAETVGYDALSAQYEDWFNGLGYCTWNGLGQDLTEAKLLGALGKISEAGIHPTSLIIDDGWQSLDSRGETHFQRGWNRFEADAKRFPQGLKAAITRLRKANPHIQHIATWHALLGYWGGIAPEGEIARKYKTSYVLIHDHGYPYLPVDKEMCVVDEPDVSNLYDDFYRFLVDAGVDSAKADVQCLVDSWVHATVRRRLTKEYFDSWASASRRHFSMRTISCMSQFPRAMFYSQMPQTRVPMLVRNSDDFYPDNDDSHRWHLWANAHNSILMQHLNILPDWDMFQTRHKFAGSHAAARCVSGGPIYITDVPGEHDLKLIKAMTAASVRGKTIILRPSVVGKTIDPYQTFQSNSLLKVGNYYGASETGTSVLGVFNTSNRPLVELIPLSNFPGTLTSLRYVIRAHASGRVSSVAAPGAQDSLSSVYLDSGGYEILCAFPVTYITGHKHHEIAVANLGLVGKMMGCAAVTRSKIQGLDNKRVGVDSSFKALGVWGVYISCLQDMTIEGDLMVTMDGQAVPIETVSKSREDPCVVEVDIEAAWEQLGLKAGWGGDVTISLHFDS